MLGDAGQDVGQPGLGVDVVHLGGDDQAVHRRRDKIESETLVSPYDDKEFKVSLGPEPTTDIAAVLSVIVRRDDENRDREKLNGWKLNFRGSDLRGADLREAHLEGADLKRAHLERANLVAAEGLALDQFKEASGDDDTILPHHLPRPQHWTRVS
jgi:Pentapeptide repeats (8 copies)